MGDSPEYRLSQLEQAVAGIRQRTEDHENDIRAFSPLVVAHARLEEKLAGIQAGLDSLRKDWQDEVTRFNTEISQLNKALEADRRSREKVRLEREQREVERERTDRRYRMATWIAAGGMILTFVSTTVGVLTLVIH